MPRSIPRPPKRPRLLVEELEPRILYSADAAALLGLNGIPGGALVRQFEPAPATDRALDAVQPVATPAVAAKAHEIVFIDSRVPDAMKLADQLMQQRGGDRLFDIVVLDANQDGVAQIDKILANEHGLTAIHIISHGSDGAIEIGSTNLDAARLAVDAKAVAQWGQSLAAGGDLLLYGCDVAQDAAGQAFVQSLARLTGADVAASTDLTGQSQLGGNWNLEYATGRIEASVAIGAQTQQDWANVLAITVGNTSSSQTTGANSLTLAQTIGSGTNGILVVTVSFQAGSSNAVTSVTYGGTALTFLGSAENASGAHTRTEMWYLKAPAAGTANVVISMNASIAFTGGATNFFGVDQTTPTGTFVGATANNRTPSVTVTSAAGELVIDSLAERATSSGTAGGTQTEAYHQLTGTAGGDTWGSSSTSAGAASVTMNWSTAGSGTGEWAMGAVSLKPFLNTAPALDAAKSPAITAINEDAGAPSGAVGTLVSKLVDFAAPSGQVDNVNDPDAGALLGIAVTTVDTTNGAWWYSTDNGSSWNALGAVADNNARLLAADADTRIYFQPNANYNGTLANAITFRAWDQTTGTAGGTADTTNVTNTTLDLFSVASYGNNDGTASWSGPWVETDGKGGGATAGDVMVTGGTLQLRATKTNDLINRLVNLAGATTATLSFNYDNELIGSDTIVAQVSNDGGATYATLATFSAGSNFGTGSKSIDISSYIASNSQVQFAITSGGGKSFFFVDNVQVSYGNSGNGGTSAFSAATDTASLVINAVNDAPVLDNTGTMVLANIQQDATNPAGTTVAALIASAGGNRITDVDAGAVEGIAITARDNSNGTWQYSTNGGVSWVAMGNVNGSQALVLSDTANDMVRFMPGAGFSGNATISFRAWDRSDGLVSGTSGVNTNTNGGITPFSSATQTASVYVEPLQVLLWMSTSGDVSGSGVPGLSNWTQSTVLTLGDPGLSLGAGTTGGRMATVTNFDGFAVDGDVNINGLHFVNRAVTLNGAGIVAGPLNLLKGDMLFVTAANESLSTAAGSPPAGWANNISTTAGDVYVFRPVTAGDYSSGYFRKVMAEPGPNATRDIALVETATTVGGTVLAAGDILFTQSGNLQQNNIYWYKTATNTASLLIDGAQIGIPGGGAGAGIDSLDLVQSSFTSGGFTFQAGDVLAGFNTQVDAVGSGGSTVTAYAQDLVRLRFTATTFGAGTAVASAMTVLDGSNIKLDTANENLDAVGMLIQGAGANVAPVVTLAGAALAYTEGAGPVIVDATATVSDVDSPNLDTGVLRVDLTVNGSPDDRLAIRNQGNGVGQIGVVGSNVSYGGVLIGTVAGGTDGSTPLLVTLNASATPAAAQALLRNVTYENVSNNPSALPRTLRVLLSDGDGATSSAVGKTINVTNVDTAPVAVNDAYSVNEDSTLVVAPSTANLANWWGFNEGGSTQTISSSGSLASSGTRGSTAGVDAADPTWTTGYVGGSALAFNGAGQYVDTTSADLKTASDFTLSAWFQTNTTTGAQHLLWAGYPGGNGYGSGGSITAATSEMSLSIGSYTATYDNKIVFFLGYDVPANGADCIFIASASNFTDTGNWHNVAVTVTDLGGGVMSASMYVDGKLEGTDTGSQNDRSIWGALRIGAPGDGTRSFNGKIDDVRVYSTALAPGTVQGIATAGVLANDSDVDSATLKVNTSVVTGPANGTLSINSDGSFTYTPNANFYGTDSFTYKANDDVVNSNVATATITVNPVVDTPSVTNATTNEDTQSTTGLVISRNAADGAEVGYFQITGISNGTLYQNDGTTAIANNSFITFAQGNAGLKFTPAANFNGNGSFTVQASTTNAVGGLGGSTVNATITVNAVNDAPVITSNGGGASAAASVAENTTAVTTVNSSDVDGGAPVYSILAGGDAAKFTINSTTGALSFIAAPDFENPTDIGANNVYDLTVQVSDGAGGADTQAISVTVTDVSSALIVTTAADNNDSGIVNGNGTYNAEWLNANKGADNAISLREAILAANNTSGSDTIAFAIASGGAVKTITLTSALPSITDAVTIDGTTQTTNIGDTNPGQMGSGGTVGVDGLALSLVDRPEVEIAGSNSIANGLNVLASNSTIRGLAIYGFGNGAYNNGFGNIVVGPGVSGTLIQGNVLGSGAVAFADPGAGVRTGGANILFDHSGSATVTNNLIGFANAQGIWGYSTSTNLTITNNEVRGNGLGAFNWVGGVEIDAGASHSIGGNLITGNVGPGVNLSSTTGTEIVRNNTVSLNGAGNNMTAGVRIGGGTGAVVDKNLIASNVGAGVLVASTASGVTISQNSIYSNGPVSGQIGIDLLNAGDNQSRGTSPFVTLNDAGDSDAGGNGLQNSPVLSSARVVSGTQITVAGTINSTANSFFRIEFFSSTAQDGSSYGEGQTYLGSVNVTTDGSGNASFNTTLTASVASGSYVSATATKSNATFTVFADTSEFARNVAALSQGIVVTPVSVMPLGSETRVNTNTSDVQTINPNVAQAVASDAAGNFVVVWASNLQDGSSYGVYAQRFAADGTAQGSEFLVNTTTADNQLNAAVAMDAAGNFVVTWSSNLQDGSGYGIYAQRFNAAGVAQGSEFLVNTTTAGSQTTPAIAMSPTGGFVIAWTGGGQDPDASAGIYAQRFNAGGVAQGSEFRVNTYTSNTQQLTSAAMDGAGNFVVVWASLNQDDGASYGVYGQRFDATGAAQGAEFRVNTTIVNSQLYNDVAMLEDGRFVVAYQSRNADGSFEVFLQRYAADGSTLGGETRVNTSTVSSAQQPIPSVAADSSGNITVVWNSAADGSGVGVVGRRLDWSGTPLGGEFQVNTTTAGDQLYAEVVAQPSGGFIVAWGGNGAGDADGVFLQRYGLTTTEAGGSATFQVVLEAAPTADVVIAVSVPDGTEGSVSVASLTFTTADWNIAQTVTVTGMQDYTNDGNVAYTVVLGSATSTDLNFNGLNPADLSVTNLEVPNVAPVNTVPGAQTVNEDTALVFSSANGNAIAIGDADAGSNTMQLTLSVTNGVLTLGGVSGLSFSAGANGSASMTFTGTIANINTALNGLRFDPTANFNGSAVLTLNTNDQGNSGTGGAKSDNDSVAITVNPVNDEQVLATNTGVTVAENSTGTVITSGMLATTDIDNTAAQLIYTVSSAPANGTLRRSGVALTAGSTFSQADINGGLVTYDHNGTETASDAFGFSVDDGAGATSSGSFAITVTPVNDNPPLITSNGGGASASVNVAENSTAVSTVAATDADLPAQTLTYSISGGADAAKFAINSSTGALSFLAAPDCEAPVDVGGNNVYDVIVQVSDGTLTDTQAIAVTVTPVNDNVPVITSDGGGATASVNVAENVTAVTTVTATDADLPVQTLTYSISGGADAAKFSINSSTGALSFVAAPDFEAPTDAGANNVYDVMVQVSDGTLTDTQAIAVTVTPVSDNAPVITSDGGGGSTAINVAENSSAVTTVTATDADLPAQTLTYSVAGGADAAKFTINASTGVLTFASAPNYEVPTDAGANNIYDVIVQVSDGTLTDTQAIAVTVTAVNDNNPVITSDGGGASASVNVVEDTSAVTTVTASDADLPSQTLTYSISGGADAAKFTINSSTGVLSFLAAPDYETPSDVGANNVYNVIVQVSDGALSDTQTVAVTVTPVNDNAPVITSDGGGASASVSVGENSTSVTTVAATDADLPAQTLNYSIVGGADAGKFTINASTGALNFVAAPDFEAPSDAGTNNVYDVLVQVSDGTLTDTQAIAVTVTAVNDNNPVITSDGGSAAATVNVAENATAVTTVTASDADLPAQTLTYSISGGADAAKFSINSSSGVLSFVAAPDYEAPTDAGANNVYDVIVQVSDGTLTDTQAIAVTVTPVNDNGPAITSDGGGATASVSVAENSTSVTTVAATDADLPAQTLNYSIVGGADAGKFTVNSSTGVLAFVAAPDYEAPTDAGANNIYDVIVQVSDGTLTATQAIAVAVTPANDNAPVITSDGGGATASVSVAENSMAVTTVTATDADLPAQTLTYSINGGADAARFAINSATGTLSFVAAPDYETPADAGADNVYDVIVQVSDGTLTDTQSIAVTVTAFNDNAPVITSDGGGATAGVSVAENSTAVTTVSATDADLPAQTLTYSISGGADAARFTIDSSTGVLSFLAAPNYEVPTDAGANNVYDVIVQVTDGTLTDAQAIAVTVSPVNDNTPVITSDGGGANAAVNVAENTTAVTILAAADADLPAQTLTYSISGGADAAKFTINSSTGVLSFLAAPDSETPTDAGANNVYDVIVQVSDGSLTDTQAIAITVTPLNDNAPVIGSDGGGANAAINVAENSTAVTTVAAADGDLPAQTLAYSIVGGADAGKFSINSSTGALAFVAAPDYEVPTDAGANNVYDVIVQVSDGSLTDTQAIAVTVTPVNEGAPVITSDGGGASATMNVAENSAAVTTVAATDADLPAQSLTYSISGGADATRFTINSATGALSFVAAPDYEAPTDAGLDNVYDVTVQVSDGSLTDTQSIAVTVTPMNDNAPVITSDGAAATASLSVAENTGAVTAVTATDADMPGQALTYSISGGADAARFIINGSTGALTFIAAPDYETPADADANNVYDVIVQVSDGTLTDTQAIAVTVTQVNDNVPAITSDGGGASATVNVAENTAAVTTVTATDADLPAQTLTYSISGGADAARFTINTSTGVLTFVAAPDFESPTDAGANNVYDVIVQVSDGTLTAAQAIAVAVMPVNDNAPVITSDGGGASAAINVAENSTAITTVTATDADLPGQSLTYSISGGADAAKFSINSSTGALAFIAAPNYEAPTDAGANNVYDVVVQVSDGTLTATQSIALTVTAVNDNAPVITSDGGGATATLNAAENSAAVSIVTATDADLPAQTLTYSISGGADGARFTIDSSTGVLSFAAAPDYETPADAGADNVYDVIVQVSDGTLTSTQAIAVMVDNVNEAPVITSDGSGATATRNVAENDTVVTTVTATDVDAATTLTYSISGGADAAKFTIDASSGALSFVAAPDFETPTDAGADNVYDVIVQVSDGTLTDTQAIAVSVTPVSDNAPVITSNGGGATATVNVAENATAVSTVMATDADLPAQTLTYSIVGGADAGRFTINAATGVLSFVTAPDYEAPSDAGVDNVYDVTVQVSDGTLTDSQAIAVAVTAVNDNAPVINSNGGGASASLSVAENTTAVTTVTASDADLPIQTLTYSIAGGADAGRFNIDSATGALSFVATPDFEAPSDSGADNTYDVIVQASDATLASTQAIAVTVLDVNEAPQAADHFATVAEGTALAIDLAAGAADVDAGANGSIDLSSAVIVVGPTRGSLVLNADGTATYSHDGSETTSDSFSYTLRDAAGATSNVATVRLTVTPVNDAPTVAAATLSLRAGQGLVLDATQLQATDPDNAAASLSFAVSNVSNGRFEWVAAPGAAITQFTQADVAAGRVRFVSTSGTDAPTFRVMAFDGQLYSAEVSGAIVFTPDAVLPADDPATVPPKVLPGVAGPADATVQSSLPVAAPIAASAAELPAPGHDVDLSDAPLVRFEPAASRQGRAAVAAEPVRSHASGSDLDLSVGIADDYAIRALQLQVLDAAQPARPGLHAGPQNDSSNAVQTSDEESSTGLTLVEAAQITGVALTAGTVWWALRAGGLLAGLMVSLPAWRHADLLAVLPDDEEDDNWDLAEDDEAARDEQAVAQVFEPAFEGDLR